MARKNNKIELDGVKYNTSDLSDSAKNLLANLANLHALSSEKANMIAVLTKAKKAYMADLKVEMLSAKSGFDFSE